MTLSKKGLYVMLSINGKEHKHNTALHYAQCGVLFIVVLRVVMLNVVMLSVVVPEILGN
jgi:hypothetical protein